MRACVFKDGKFELACRPRPAAPQGGALVKVLAASICGTDYRTFLHGSGKIAEGAVIGHEVCGRIEEADGCPGFAVGDRVTVAPALGCGHCYMCEKGHTNMCDDLHTLGFEFDGSFAEYMAVPAGYFLAGHVTKVPERLTSVQAVLAEPVACAINAQQFLGIGSGDYVAIFGSGFLGCVHAELAFASGAEVVVMIEPGAARAKAAAKLVPRVRLVGDGEDVRARVMELTGGRGADVAIVACSVGAAQQTAQQIIAKRGRISLFGGLPGDGKGFIDSNIIHYKEVGVFGVHASTAENNRRALSLIADGKIDVGKYVTEYPLENVLEAFADIRDRGIMKAVLIPQEG